MLKQIVIVSKEKKNTIEVTMQGILRRNKEKYSQNKENIIFDYVATNR